MIEANLKRLRQETAHVNVLLGGTICWVSQKQLRHGGTGVGVICCVQQTQRESRTRSGCDVGLSGCRMCKSTCKIQNCSWLHLTVFPTRWGAGFPRLSFPVVFKENSKVGYLYFHSGGNTWIPCQGSTRKFYVHISPPSSKKYKPKRTSKGKR